MDVEMQALGAEGLRTFRLLCREAVDAVTERLYAVNGAAYEPFGPDGRAACREYLGFHLEFLQPVLEFGLLQPMADYLDWLGSVLGARGIPADHIVQSLDLFCAFFGQRLTPADAAVVTAGIEAARRQFLHPEAHAYAMPPTPPEPWPESVDFTSALLAGNQREASAVVDHCIDGGHDLIAIELHVVQPSLYHVGEEWQANRVSVAKEHMATALALSIMTAALLRALPPVTLDRRVLLACVPGNQHAVGLRMVGDAFQLAGWELRYLGADAPSADIVREAEEWQAHLVGLSVSFAHQLPAAKEIIAGLSERLGGSRPAVIIGGLAINRFTRLADMAGADAFGPDASAAVATGARLVGARSP
jgi:MerR family transcriptional regulator, light-induced transcriptional regulator